MAFADPQSITINSETTTLNRVAFGTNSGRFASTDGTVAISVSHKGTGKSASRLLRLEMKKIAADPLTSENMEAMASAHVVLSVPRAGFSTDEQQQLLTALADYLKSGTVATKFIGGEA